MTIHTCFTATFALGLLLLTPTLAGAEEVPLSKHGGVYHVPVTLNGAANFSFVVDSGAADVVLPQSAADQLLQKGALSPSDRLPDGVAVTADGSHVKTARYTLKSVTVGSVTVSNVEAAIVPTGDEGLLGETFLEKLPYWSLDAQKMVLVLGSATNHVGDTAHLFSDAMVRQLNDHIDRFHRDHGKEIVILTVPGLAGHSRDDLVDQFMHGRKLNGVLIFIAVQDKLTLLKVGTQTAQVLTPPRQQELKTAINGPFRQGKFDDGIKAGMVYLENLWKQQR